MSHVTAVPCQDGCEEVTKAIDIIFSYSEQVTLTLSKIWLHQLPIQCAVRTAADL